MARQSADGEVVVLGPAFLETDDCGGWGLEGDLAADFCEARVPVRGDVFETPDVVG